MMLRRYLKNSQSNFVVEYSSTSKAKFWYYLAEETAVRLIFLYIEAGLLNSFKIRDKNYLDASSEMLAPNIGV